MRFNFSQLRIPGSIWHHRLNRFLLLLMAIFRRLRRARELSVGIAEKRINQSASAANPMLWIAGQESKGPGSDFPMSLTRLHTAGWASGATICDNHEEAAAPIPPCATPSGGPELTNQRVQARAFPENLTLLHTARWGAGVTICDSHEEATAAISPCAPRSGSSRYFPGAIERSSSPRVLRPSFKHGGNITSSM